jgi:8-oxo-dGTP pyrophosphatase MutT (NUDIX family)/phosphohistidine phosphatase SixA
MATQIEAAGGVVWRPGASDGLEVAVVHRPKYDDWSVPKGKLTAGEHPILGALREVYEETGQRTVPGRPLGEINYLKDGVPKRVRYWALRAESGAFLPGAEVDQLIWLPPREAVRHLSPDRDRSILEEFGRDTSATWPVVIIRHGSAGERASWSGDDRERPLDELGHRQAEALASLLAAFRIVRVFSADVLRCLQTVAPYAAQHRLTVQSEPLLSETGVAEQPGPAVARLRGILAEGEPVAVCSQGKAMPALLAGVCKTLGHVVPPDTSTRKGGFWVLHAAAGDGELRLSAAERFPPPG